MQDMAELKFHQPVEKIQRDIGHKINIVCRCFCTIFVEHVLCAPPLRFHLNHVENSSGEIFSNETQIVHKMRSVKSSTKWNAVALQIARN